MVAACLQIGYGPNFVDVFKKDQSVASNFDVLGSYYYKIAENTGINYGNTIVEYPDNSDYSGLKNVLNYALFIYESNELDSVAKAEYMKFKIGGDKLYK